jgi:Holliday junction resolvase
MLEKSIENRLVAKIKVMGGAAVKFTSPSSKGWPDRLVILPGNRIVFVELKTTKGKLSALQKLRIEFLTAMGCDVRVMYGIDDVEAFQ